MPLKTTRIIKGNRDSRLTKAALNQGRNSSIGYFTDSPVTECPAVFSYTHVLWLTLRLGYVLDDIKAESRRSNIRSSAVQPQSWVR